MPCPLYPRCKAAMPHCRCSPLPSPLRPPLSWRERIWCNSFICQDVYGPWGWEEERKGNINATRTLLGWSLNSPIESETTDGERAFPKFIRADDGLDKQGEQFCKLETSAILADSVPQLSGTDKKALEIWEQSIQIVAGHYHMHINMCARFC